LVGISGHIVHGEILKVKVKTINNSSAKWTEDRAIGRDGAERLPHQVCCSNCFSLGGKSTLVVGTTSGRKEDGLSKTLASNNIITVFMLKIAQIKPHLCQNL
jgi:hypothetical protein